MTKSERRWYSEAQYTNNYSNCKWSTCSSEKLNIDQIRLFKNTIQYSHDTDLKYKDRELLEGEKMKELDQQI